MQNHHFKIWVSRICLALLLWQPSHSFAEGESGGSTFEEFEIRVIKPRYFSKRYRLELGSQFIAVTNQTFIYTYLASANLGYHVTESLGLRFTGAFGFSSDKSDRESLQNQFEIKTQILPTSQILSGEGMWTPMYGKFQLSSGRLIYFDTYFSGGLGSTTIGYTFDQCSSFQEGNRIIPKRQPRSQSYFTYLMGIGQRFFLSDKESLNWDIKTQYFTSNPVDGGCVEEEPDASKDTVNQNLTVQFGYSRFIF